MYMYMYLQACQKSSGALTWSQIHWHTPPHVIATPSEGLIACPFFSQVTPPPLPPFPLPLPLPLPLYPSVYTHTCIHMYIHTEWLES